MAELHKKTSVVRLLRQIGLSELACQFALFVERQDKSDDDLIALTAGLLSEAVSQGKVSLTLKKTGEEGSAIASVLPETMSDWIIRLRQSHLIGEPGAVAPMILTCSGQLYLYRYWHDEQLVNDLITARLKPIVVTDMGKLRQDFTAWGTSQQGIDWQKVAVMMAMTRQLSVISGGPGTGKTTIVLRLLQLLLNQNRAARIALVAPTGKAAGRLQQAVTDQLMVSIEAKTIHRLLGITIDNEQGRYHVNKPLPVDILIVDEASMIDISLMATMMKALPSHARLVLLGDSDQLASIGSGAVLADLCREGQAFSQAFCQQLQDATGIALSDKTAAQTRLTDSVVMLQHSYRFDQSSIIGQLALAVKAGDNERVMMILLSSPESIWAQQFNSNAIQRFVMPLYSEFFDAVKKRASAAVCLALFEQIRVLCALKKGPESVDSVNIWVERHLATQGWRTQYRFYHGRPIMVTQNDYRHDLFNGDTGLVLYDQQGQLAACFLNQGLVRWLPLNRLPAHETAFAMTVHKSQGSEFDKVCVVLPEQPSPVLNQALLYTAITRAKLSVSLLASEAVLLRSMLADLER